MMTLDPKIQKKLDRAAEKAGINVQELLRARIIPDWLYGPPVISNRTIERLRRKGLIPTEPLTGK